MASQVDSNEEDQRSNIGLGISIHLSYSVIFYCVKVYALHNSMPWNLDCYIIDVTTLTLNNINWVWIWTILFRKLSQMLFLYIAIFTEEDKSWGNVSYLWFTMKEEEDGYGQDTYLYTMDSGATKLIYMYAQFWSQFCFLT